MYSLMGVKVAGNYEYLNCGDYLATLVVDSFAPEHCIWIMAPIYSKVISPKERVTSSSYAELLKVICSPKNSKAAQEVVRIHNEIVTSPLARVMSEAEET